MTKDHQQKLKDAQAKAFECDPTETAKHKALVAEWQREREEIDRAEAADGPSADDFAAMTRTMDAHNPDVVAGC